MSNRKRLEIILDSPHLPALRRILDKANVTGYTLIPHVLGRGNRGDRMGSGGLTDVDENCMVIIAVMPDKMEYILQRVRPLLSDVGGVCLISDCTFLDHE